MIRHDFQCTSCGRRECDVMVSSTEIRKTCICGEQMELLFQWSKTPHIGIHPKDRAIVWYNPKTGKHATPGRNDVPMPERYRKLGYERKEFTTLRELDSFCKRNSLVNEKANYDGSGRSYDDEVQ